MQETLINKGKYKILTPSHLIVFKPKLLSISDAEISPVNVRIKICFFSRNYLIDDIAETKIYKYLSFEDKEIIENHKFCSDLIEGVRENGSYKLANGAIVRGYI